MAKTTIADACRKRGIQRGEWDEAKRQGVDPWNHLAMEKWLKSRRHRIKPGASIPDESPESKAQTVEEIEDAIKRAGDIDTVKILKEKLAAIKIAVGIRADTRELVPVGEVRDHATRMYSVVRGELLKITSSAPPRLAGLTESECHMVLREIILEIMQNLSDETNEIFPEQYV